MFCRNCGKELIGSPEFCPNCGARFMSGTSFCPGCGAPTTPLTEICTKCGARVTKKTGSAWQTLTAGILDLVLGVPCLIIGIFFAAGVEIIGQLAGVPGIGTLFGAPLIIFATLAIAGGIFALRKRVWGLALAGSICAFIAGLAGIWPAIFLGIPAIVFTVLGKKHFG